MNSSLTLVLIRTGCVLALSGALFVAGCSRSPAASPPPAASAEKTLYTCGMHPWIIQDHPGDCPICGMKLEPVHKNSESGQAASTLNLDPAAIQLMNIQTTEITPGPLRRTIRTVGTIDYNETALADVTTKFKGWIEKLDADATGGLVHRGEPLFEIYSPELYSAEAEYLATGGTNADSGTAAMCASARAKLKFLDLTDNQIAALEQAGQPARTMSVLAPMDGFIMEKEVVAGQMVEAGAKLYRLADLGIVWVYAQVYELDLPYIQLGQEAVVKLSALPDREFRGRVTYVYPDVDVKTRTARVRLEFENPGYFLKPGMFVSVQIVSELAPSALLVPDSAVLRSGAHNTVFVALPGGKFAAREVGLGLAAGNDQDEVVSGLAAGDRVVTAGQFMLDSESQLREAIQKMNGPAGASLPATTPAPVTPTPAAANIETVSVVYVCPMPEHVSITYDHPGNCPICGMALVPVNAQELQRLQPGGKVLYYTCPMPEHSYIHSDKPGKCPECGMTLIPVMAPPDAPKPVPAGQAAAHQLYTCPMHPEVISEEPGKCPKCGMNLVPVPGAANK